MGIEAFVKFYCSFNQSMSNLWQGIISLYISRTQSKHALELIRLFMMKGSRFSFKLRDEYSTTLGKGILHQTTKTRVNFSRGCSQYTTIWTPFEMLLPLWYWLPSCSHVLTRYIWQQANVEGIVYSTSPFSLIPQNIMKLQINLWQNRTLKIWKNSI